MNPPLHVLIDWDSRRLRLAGDLIGRQLLWEAKLPLFLRSHWLFCLSRWYSLALAVGHWSDAAMHAGCRRRSAAEVPVEGTGSEASQLWGRRDACRDPRLLRSPPVRCWLAEGSGPWFSEVPTPSLIGWSEVASSEGRGTALCSPTNHWQDKSVKLDWILQKKYELWYQRAHFWNLTFVVAGTYLDVLLSRRRRRFFQAGLVIRPTSSTSDHAHPTWCRWLSLRWLALSGSGEPAGVPGPGDASPLWPRRSAAGPCDRAAQGWRRGGGGVWLCRSNRGGRRGRAGSRPTGHNHEYNTKPRWLKDV